MVLLSVFDPQVGESPMSRRRRVDRKQTYGLFTHDLIARSMPVPKAFSALNLIEPKTEEGIEPPLCPKCKVHMQLTCNFKHSEWFECCDYTIRVTREPRVSKLFSPEETPDWYEKAKVIQRIRARSRNKAQELSTTSSDDPKIVVDTTLDRPL